MTYDAQGHRIRLTSTAASAEVAREVVEREGLDGLTMHPFATTAGVRG